MDLNIMDFIVKDFIWIIPALIVIGTILKNIPKFPDWLIPIMLIAFGIIVAGVYRTWTTEAILQGFICGLAATGLHQSIKQPIKELNKEKE